ncbi:hypothetical protein [Flavobacterium humi]|uniref:Lipoprotein n=1 Tax=Flavobacterium humi TaxID=2562683 RepID=A0A4Z0L4I2_9FLAO|nr:hypothetical protein [Flavobacterium humi]TGD57258.1 hypothetical protein E4635_11585 [Flavobacterium humi]
MKTFKKTNVMKSFAVALFASVVFFASCNKEEAVPSENENITAKAPGELNFQPPGSALTMQSCPETLVNDGCNFTSGTGTDLQNQFTMVSLLNSCRIESLSPGCSWTSTTQTKLFNADLSNCCFSAGSLNTQIDGWKQMAVSMRPGSDYVITGYQRINGFMVTAYGPYRMVISVTYRKKVCSRLPAEPSLPIGTQLDK